MVSTFFSALARIASLNGPLTFLTVKLWKMLHWKSCWLMALIYNHYTRWAYFSSKPLAVITVPHIYIITVTSYSFSFQPVKSFIQVEVELVHWDIRRCYNLITKCTVPFVDTVHIFFLTLVVLFCDVSIVILYPTLYHLCVLNTISSKYVLIIQYISHCHQSIVCLLSQ